MTDLHVVHCPFCDAASAELISLFGSQLLLSQYRCARCGTYFEGLRRESHDAPPRHTPTLDKDLSPLSTPRDEPSPNKLER